MADILSTGSPEYAAVELVRASLEAGSTDNVTCVVADVLERRRRARAEPEALVVGAAAERRLQRGRSGGLFRGHRSGDTGELDPVPADLPDDAPYDAIDADPEAVRYAPRPPRRYIWAKRLFALAIVVGLGWLAVRGDLVVVPAPVLRRRAGRHGRDLPRRQRLDRRLRPLRALPDHRRRSWTGCPTSTPARSSDGIDADDLEDAQRTVQNLAENQEPETSDTETTG